MYLNARTDAIGGPCRIGAAALKGQGHACLIPRVAAACWPLKADGIATGRIHATWGRMHCEGRSRARASANCDAHEWSQIGAGLIPHNPAAVRLDGADGRRTLHIRAAPLRVRLEAIASPAARARRKGTAEAKRCIGECLLHAD